MWHPCPLQTRLGSPQQRQIHELPWAFLLPKRKNKSQRSFRKGWEGRDCKAETGAETLVQKRRETDEAYPLSTPYLFPLIHLDISLGLTNSQCLEDTSWFILLPNFQHQKQDMLSCKAWCSAEQHGRRQEQPMLGCSAVLLCAVGVHPCTTGSAGWDAPSCPLFPTRPATKKYFVVYEQRRKRLRTVIFSLFTWQGKNRFGFRRIIKLGNDL